MSSESPHAKTLSPAKQPDVNPWIARKAASSRTRHDGAGAGEGAAEEHQSADPADKNAPDTPVLAPTTSPSPSAAAQRIKPTAKGKWVPYDDAVIIVDAAKENTRKDTNQAGAKKKKKPHSNAVSSKTRRHDETASAGANGGAAEPQTARDNKIYRTNGGEYADDGSSLKGLVAGTEALALADSGTDVSRGAFEPDYSAGGLASGVASVGSLSPAQQSQKSLGSPVLIAPGVQKTSANSSRKNSKSMYKNSPRFRSSSATHIPIPIHAVQSPFVSSYLYQPVFSPFSAQSPLPYPMPNYGGSARYNSRNNSSSSSINELALSGSASPNAIYGSKTDLGQFYAAAAAAAAPPPPPPAPAIPPPPYVGFYQVSPHQQPIYTMMPPPSPHHSPYYLDPTMMGQGGIYQNGTGRYSYSSGGGKRKSKSRDSTKTLEADVASQLDYYFSKENLIKDTYLRSQMQDGYVNLKVILTFARFKSLTGGDMDLAIRSLSKSRNVEYKFEGDEYFLKSKFEYLFSVKK